jgi:NitT/TauT family transport system permease protein
MSASTPLAPPTRESGLADAPDADIAIARAATKPSHMQRRGIAYIQLLMLIVMLVVWEGVARIFKTDFWTSSPSAVVEALYKWYESGQLLDDLKITLFEAGVGFVLGSVSGGLVGFVLGWVRKLGDLFEPFILSLYTLPKIALAPLFVLWFGIGVSNKVMFSAMLVFFMVFFTTFQGTRQVDRDLVENARLLGASRFQTWTKIAIPYSAVWVFTGLRIGLPYALIGAIVGEFVAADSGVGFRIKEATSFFNTAAVFAGLLLLMAISILLLSILKLIERRALRWQTADTLNEITREP